MKPTPGPWFDDGYRIHAPTKDADKRNGRVIVEYKHVEDSNPADAALISAAPDLLVSLRVVLTWVTVPITSQNVNEFQSAMISANNAIFKATGGGE